MGTLVGMGNTAGMVVMDGPGMRGRFTMAALKTPELEVLNLSGSPLLVKGIVIVIVVASTLTIVIAGAIVTGGVIMTGGTVVTGGAVVVTTTGTAIVTGMGTTEMGIN